MIPMALAHAHATLHLHPEAVAIAAVSFALSIVAWKVMTGIRRRKDRAPALPGIVPPQPK